MPVRLLPTVAGGLQIPLALALLTAQSVYQALGFDLVILALRDGETPLHLRGYASDLGISDQMTRDELGVLFDTIRRRLGPCFAVSIVRGTILRVLFNPFLDDYLSLPAFGEVRAATLERRPDGWVIALPVDLRSLLPVVVCKFCGAPLFDPLDIKWIGSVCINCRRGVWVVNMAAATGCA